MKKKILIVNKSILGINHFKATLNYKLTTELEKYYDIEYLMFLQPKHYFEFDKFSKKSGKLIKLKYNSEGFVYKTINSFSIIRSVCKELVATNCDLVWMSITSNILDVFSFIFVFFFDREKIILQLFTPSISKSAFERNVLDYLIALNLKIFPKLAGKNDKLIIRYRLKRRELVDVKLGMFDYGFQERDYAKIKLVYVGTFVGRDVHKTVEAVARYNKKFTSKISYDIIGKGSKEDKLKIENVIRSFNMNKYIKMHGVVSNEELLNFLKINNVGVAFVPLKEFFNDVKVTKTIEYLLTGMPVIATKNTYNLVHVNNSNGILVDDTIESFHEALVNMKTLANQMDYMQIRKGVIDLSLNYTISKFYIPFVESVIHKN